ncbi:hypothetical protein KUF71_002423 [Frankliniella fusca]|uniref:RNA-directed DNA polymerase n=1 Tax=Frankliniella fusca TaxID=407009 RepID=A0AAE1LLH4_9NEOP|nr:hypothetical protein KUF71_002423 [Frankliniella fusca]
MYLADLLSRNFIEDPVEDDPEMVEVVHEVTSNLSLPAGMMDELKIMTDRDVGLKSVMGYYQNGWPSSEDKLTPETRPYWKLQNDIFVEDGLVILEDKIIVPPSLRPEILRALHAAHLGIEKTKARQVVYWPGITNDIQTLISECRVCERHSAANYKEPLLPQKIPELRFEFMSRPFLVVVQFFKVAGDQNTVW